MFKQLFEPAPPGAVENLLSTRRKIMYGVIAFAPGTLLAMYLYSVKLEMDAENKRLQAQYVADQTRDVVVQEQKDLLLTSMIDDLRERIKQLEDEARRDVVATKSQPTSENTAAKANAAHPQTPVTPATKSTQTQQPQTQETQRKLPAFLAEYEATLRPWLERWDTVKTQLKEVRAQASSLFPTRDEDVDKVNAQMNSGIRDRIASRNRDARNEDVNAFLAARRKPE